MRGVIIVALALLFAGVPVFSQGVEDEVRKAEKAWAAAVVANDQAALERELAGQLIYAHSTGAIESKSEYIGRLRDGRQKYEAIQHHSITVKAYGDAAAAHSKVRMSGTSNGRRFDDELMMLHLWVKRGGRWQLAAHQTTKLP